MELLLVEAESGSMHEAACSWIAANRQRWRSWLPKDTSCIPGFGLVNASGSYMASRSDAVACSICPSGKFSKSLIDESGQTFTCTSCSAGTSRGQAGETYCTDCEPGTVATTNGLSACQLCPFGSYANVSRMTTCYECGVGIQWTTSRLGALHGEEVWIEVEGAPSESFCHCRPGWFLHKGTCLQCVEGAVCPGSSTLTLLPGFFSSEDQPSSIFRCHGNEGRCPGGVPGTCAPGRDVASVACSTCLPGLHGNGAGCKPCEGLDYLLFAFIACLVLVGTGLLHLLLLHWDSQNRRKEHTNSSLLLAGIYTTQLVSCLQLLVMLQGIDIVWGEPFVSLLRAISILSLEDIFRLVNAVSCATPPTPTVVFLVQTVGMPACFMVGPVVIHLARIVCLRNRRRKTLQRHVLFQTIGTLSVLFFILLCNAVVKPFQCHKHPNGLFTMQSAIGALCDFTGDHFDLCVLGSVLVVLPSGFIALCSWLILVEFPRRLRSSDLEFIRMCSFLIRRFRPGCESFGIFLLVRNALFAIAPALPSTNASLLLIHVVLGLHIVLLALLKPWRSPHASFADILCSSVFLVILFQGGLFVTYVDTVSSMVLCSLLLVAVLVCLVIVASIALAQHAFAGMTKRFHFFLCHHKQMSGSLARLLKMEMQLRGSDVFLDADDLTDLTQLLPVVAEHVDTLLIVATNRLIARKWCLAEIVTARMNNVPTVLLTLPDFFPPSDHFIKAFETSTTDMSDLAVHGFSMADIGDTLNL